MTLGGMPETVAQCGCACPMTLRSSAARLRGDPYILGMKSRSTRSEAKLAPKSDPRRKRGRPSTYAPALGLAICERLVDGESLRAICNDAEMPARLTVFRWLAAHPDFCNQYARAREAQADALAEEVLAIGDDARGDLVVDADGKVTTRWENVQRSRLRCDNRKWFCAKVAPKKYGDRVTAELSGPDGRPIETREALPPMLPEEVGAAVRALVTKAEADLGLPPGRGGLKARMKAILDSGQPLPPDVYAALYGGKGRNGSD